MSSFLGGTHGTCKWQLENGTLYVTAADGHSGVLKWPYPWIQYADCIDRVSIEENVLDEQGQPPFVRDGRVFRPVDLENLQDIIDKHLHWILQDCEGWENMRADFSYANLEGMDLHGAALHAALFKCAYMYRTDLHGADLRFAVMTFSCMEQADLQNTDLKYADMHGAYMADALMQHADLESADIYNAVLTGADLEGANLYMAAVEDTDVAGANLKNAVLKGTCLEDMALEDAKDSHDGFDDHDDR